MRIVLIAVPCFLLSVLPALFLTGVAAGFLWLFVYGDNPWPILADVVVISTLLLSWILIGTLLTAALARHPAVRRLTTGKLIAATAIMSLAAIGAILLHQWSIGNLDPPHPCIAQCREAGYSSSFREIDERGRETCTCVEPDPGA